MMFNLILGIFLIVVGIIGIGFGVYLHVEWGEDAAPFIIILCIGMLIGGIALVATHDGKSLEEFTRECESEGGKVLTQTKSYYNASTKTTNISKKYYCGKEDEVIMNLE